jgi:hypothetical protein
VVNAPPSCCWTLDGQSCPATIFEVHWQLSTRLGCGLTFLVIVVY